MEFGVYVNQYQDPRNDVSAIDILDQVERIEELGFDIAALGERHFYEEGFFEPITLLSALAARTETIRLMSNVFLLPIYHPVHLAEYMSSIDNLAEGRTLFGASLGYRQSELTNFGIEMADRVPRFLESMSIVKRLLEGERFDHHGEHFDLSDVFVQPEPVQSPRPRILGGGSATVAIKRAAFRCDGFSAANTTPRELESDIETYYTALDEAGKSASDGDVTILVDGFVGESSEDAKRALTPFVVDHMTNSYRWSNPEFDGRLSWDDVSTDLIYGSVEDVVEDLRTYEDMGVDRVLFRTQFPGMEQDVALRSLERFATHVIPRFR